MPPRWYLYAIRLPVGDYAVAYLGVTKHKLRKRLISHSHEHKPISAAIRACGCDDAIIQPLVCGGRDFIYALETSAIVAFNTRWPNGYNIAGGGLGGRDPLPQTRAKIGAASRARVSIEQIERMRGFAKANNAARNRSLENIAKVRAAHLGKKRPPETGAKIAARLLGRKLSSESIAKRSAKLRGRKTITRNYLKKSREDPRYETVTRNPSKNISGETQ